MPIEGFDFDQEFETPTISKYVKHASNTDRLEKVTEEVDNLLEPALGRPRYKLGKADLVEGFGIEEEEAAEIASFPVPKHSPVVRKVRECKTRKELQELNELIWKAR